MSSEIIDYYLMKTLFIIDEIITGLRTIFIILDFKIFTIF